MNKHSLCIQTTSWQKHKTVLSAIRTSVFIEEQQVPFEDEWDGSDEQAVHLLAYHKDQAIGCARVLTTGKIGRMAVLKTYRGLGAGKALLQAALEVVKRQPNSHAHLDAQKFALGFYQAFGFVSDGVDFLDAGIVHQKMVLKL